MFSAVGNLRCSRASKRASNCPVAMASPCGVISLSLAPIAQLRGVLQQALDLLRESGGRWRADRKNIPAPSNQVGQTTLMVSLLKTVVQPQAVMHQPSIVIGPQQRGCLGKAVSSLDRVDGDLLAHRHRQHPRVATLPPPGLIHPVHQALTRRVDQLLVGRRRLLGHPRHRPADPGPADGQPMPPLQNLGGLLQRQAQLLVQQRPVG